MNWMSKLLQKSAPTTAGPAATRSAPVPAPAPTQVRAPLAADPPEVWLAAVCEVADKALALDWLSRLEGDARLAEVALAGRFSELRLAAIRRVEDTAVLERVARLSRDKDKRVYRDCAERLKARRQAGEDARLTVTLAAALRALLDAAPLNLSQLLDLEKQYRALGQDSPAIDECQALLDRARARLQQESQARRELQGRAEAALALLRECADQASIDPAQALDLRARLDALAGVQPGLPDWLSSLAPAKQLGESLREIESSLTELEAEGERVLACEAFLDGLAACPPIDAPPLTASAASSAWAALSKPNNPQARQALEARWQEVHRPASSAAPQPEKPAAVDRDALRQLLERLERLEQAAEQGQLAVAEKFAKEIAAALQGHRLEGPMEARLARATAQLGKLRGWAAWSAGQARDQLIEAAEKLLQGSPGVDDLEQGVRGLREQWKQLDSHGGARAQWQRFDALLTRAYQPVAVHRAAEAARQAAAREVKEALCGEWEAHYSAMVWQQSDYKQLEGERQEMLRRWRAAQPAGFRDERMLRKRFDKILDKLDQRLAAMRASEQERREELIGLAEALRELPDLGRAITEVKALQSRWGGQGVSVQLERRDEQKLWLRFRAVCDVVFARRDDQRLRLAAQREAGKQVALGLLDAFAAAVVAVAVEDGDSLKRALSQFRVDWKALRANDRESAEGFEPRARELERQASLAIERLQQERKNTQFDLLEQKAAILDAAEAAAVSSAQADMAAAKAAWDALPRLPGKSEGLLAQRLAAASGVTAKDLAAGRKVRETLLLDLEIALLLPTPEACAEARRKRQLEHLRMHFGADSLPTPEAEELLLRWYATAAAPDAALDQRLAAVKQRLLAVAK